MDMNPRDGGKKRGRVDNLARHFKEAQTMLMTRPNLVSSERISLRGHTQRLNFMSDSTHFRITPFLTLLIAELENIKGRVSLKIFVPEYDLWDMKI